MNNLLEIVNTTEFQNNGLLLSGLIDLLDRYKCILVKNLEYEAGHKVREVEKYYRLKLSKLEAKEKHRYYEESVIKRDKAEVEAKEKLDQARKDAKAELENNNMRSQYGNYKSPLTDFFDRPDIQLIVNVYNELHTLSNKVTEAIIKLSTPISKGINDHPGGPAIVGEGEKEAVVFPKGSNAISKELEEKLLTIKHNEHEFNERMVKAFYLWKQTANEFILLEDGVTKSSDITFEEWIKSGHSTFDKKVALRAISYNQKKPVEKVLKIRYNTENKGTLKWRVIIEREEQLFDEVEFNVKTWTTEDEVAEGKIKNHLTCAYKTLEHCYKDRGIKKLIVN